MSFWSFSSFSTNFYFSTFSTKISTITRRYAGEDWKYNKSTGSWNELWVTRKRVDRARADAEESLTNNVGAVNSASCAGKGSMPLDPRIVQLCWLYLDNLINKLEVTNFIQSDDPLLVGFGDFDSAGKREFGGIAMASKSGFSQ